MKVERCPSSTGSASRVRFCITLVIVLMVISSPVVMLANPALIAAEAPLSAPSTLGQDGSDFTAQALSSLTARPTNNIVNTNSFYDIVFLTGISGAIKTIQVTFPAGTTIPNTAFFNEAEKCVPGSNCVILTGTASKSGQMITFTVTSAVNVPAGTKIRLEFSNINNPVFPSTNYKVTVTTRNAANTPIDGPTQSTAYTVKQIGTNVIANGAVTSGDVSSSFIRTKQLADGQNGWEPDGNTNTFFIDDTTITDNSNIFANIVNDNANDICTAENRFPSLGFNLACTSLQAGPSDGATLRYTVIDQPET